MAHATHANTLPADLGAPAFVDSWRTRALTVALVFSVIAAGLGFADGRGIGDRRDPCQRTFRGDPSASRGFDSVSS